MAMIGAIRTIKIMTTIRQAGIMATIREIRITVTIIKRKTPDPDLPMRYLLLILAVIPLLALNGCSTFSSSRNTANDRDHPGNGAEASHSSVLGLGENQGN